MRVHRELNTPNNNEKYYKLTPITEVQKNRDKFTETNERLIYLLLFSSSVFFSAFLINDSLALASITTVMTYTVFSEADYEIIINQRPTTTTTSELAY